jgi:hypothetical protein
VLKKEKRDDEDNEEEEDEEGEDEEGRRRRKGRRKLLSTEPEVNCVIPTLVGLLQFLVTIRTGIFLCFCSLCML